AFAALPLLRSLTVLTSLQSHCCILAAVPSHVYSYSAFLFHCLIPSFLSSCCLLHLSSPIHLITPNSSFPLHLLLSLVPLSLLLLFLFPLLTTFPLFFSLFYSSSFPTFLFLPALSSIFFFFNSFFFLLLFFLTLP